MKRHLLALTLVTTSVVSCTTKAVSGEPGVITVRSTATGCELSGTTAPSGNLSFDVTNDGSAVTEFYVFADDGLRIVGEVENIGPGITRTLVVRVGAGDYVTACKPGMTGDGLRASFTVTDSGVPLADGSAAELLAAATSQYQLYVDEQSHLLLERTTEFAALYLAGDDAAARALYPVARTYWERIEPVAESFGDLDPKLDLREADLEPGQAWTGWHAIEKDLWPPADGHTPLTTDERRDLAEQLVKDTEDLALRVDGLQFDPTQLGNGAKELLDEVATTKISGEEEIWSHTDLWDFQANVDGARIAFECLRPALDTRDPALAAMLDERFDALQSLLDTHRSGDGFVLYTELIPAEVATLADAVDALAEPLSHLTAAVVL